jgi:hypothetical protein
MIEEERSPNAELNNSHNYTSKIQNKTLVAHQDLSKQLRLNLQGVAPSSFKIPSTKDLLQHH